MSHIIADVENPGRVIYSIPPIGESFSGIEDGAIGTDQLASDAVSGIKLKIGSQSWSHDVVFSSSDADTVAWASGTITMADGSTTYSISAGNTGNMSARTYIYLDIGTSTTVLQTTTTAGTAVGDGKVLLAVAEDSTNAANFQVFGGIGGMMITGGEIENLMVEAADIAAGAIEEAKLANLAVSEAKIAANAVTATKINVVGLDGATGRIVVADATDADVVTGGVNTHATTLIQAGKILISGSTSLEDWRHTSDATMIDGGDIYTNSITATQINADTITANEIVANTITATEIANSTITDTQIASLSATKITTGTLTLTSGGVNLVASSGALTLNRGADIVLEASASDSAELKIVDENNAANYVRLQIDSSGRATLKPEGSWVDNKSFYLGWPVTSNNFQNLVFCFNNDANFYRNTTALLSISASEIIVGGTAAVTLRPRNIGVSHCGDSTNYWFEVHSKNFTDRTCLFDSKDGVELQDGRKVSNVAALKQMEKHPTKKVPQGLPAFNYRTLPKAAYRPATIPDPSDREGIPCPRDKDDLPYVWEDNETKKHTVKKGKKPATKVTSADGAEMTAMISVLMGAVKELDDRLAKIE